jgi:ribonuclease BN (tRNA processing enzyme)
VTPPAAGFELVVLGAGPAYTDRPGAVGAAYLLRHGTDVLLLDLGQGAFTNLAATIEPSTLAAIAISHLHPDHFIDLVSLRHYLRYEFHPPRRVAVIAPAGLTDRLDALHAHAGFTAESLDVTDLRPGVRAAGGFTLEAVRVQHTDDSHAFRVSIGAGAGLVYSGDCGAADDLRPLIRPGDTLLAEATYGADPVTPGSNHLNAMDVARLAAQTSVGRVLLTHVLIHRDRPRAVAAAEALVSVPVEIVDPGDRFAI